MNKKFLIKIIIALVVLSAIFVGYQMYVVYKAHLTFENYAAFRGCQSTPNKTATSSDCTLKSGQTIKLVEIDGKWFLEGDGPGMLGF